MSFPGTIQSPMETSATLPPWMLGQHYDIVMDDDDRQKARMVWDMLQKAKKHRDNWAKHWDRYWMLWEGEQWRRQRPQSLHQAVVNEVFSSIETFIGHVAEDIPPVRAKARNFSKKSVAELFTKILLYEDEQNEFDSELIHVLRSAAVTGVGWWRADWDDTKMRGKGDVFYRVVDEKFVFVSPFARKLSEASYLIEAKNVPREYVTRVWPDRKDSIPPGIWDGSLTNIRVTGGVNRLWDTAANFTTTDGSQTQQTFGAQQANRTNKDLVTLLEAWIRQEDGSMRYLVLANGVVLQDGPSPYDDDEFPYVAVNLIPTLDTIYGRSLIQFVERLQEELNFLHSYNLDYQEFAANNPLVVDIENVHEGEVLTNEPGAIFINQSQRGPGYYPLQMPGPNNSWTQLQEHVRNLMDGVLGRVDVLKGERPAGINTLGGLEIIRQEANVRLARMVDWVASSKRRLSILVVHRIQQFMKDERMFRIMGTKGQEEYVSVNQTVGYDTSAQPIRENEIPEDVELDIDLVHDSPGGKQAAVELALALAKTPAQDGLPMVDRRYVLETALSDSVEVSDVLTRMEELSKQQQQASLEAAKAKSGQPDDNPVSEEDLKNKILSVMMGR